MQCLNALYSLSPVYLIPSYQGIGNIALRTTDDHDWRFYMIPTSAGVSGMLIIHDTLFQCLQRSDIFNLEVFCFSAFRYTSLLYMFCFRHFKLRSGTFFGQEEGLGSGLV